MGRKPQRETFGETVARLEAQADEPGRPAAWEHPYVIDDGEWVDDQGRSWRRRSDGSRDVPVARIERLVRNPQVPLLHVYDRVSWPTGDARAELWHRARPYVLDQVVRDEDDYTDFAIAEFRDDGGRVMLVVEEYC